MKHLITRKSLLPFMFLFFLASSAFGEGVPNGIVKVAKATVNGKTTYRYQVVNNTAFPIAKVIIGMNYFDGTDATLKSTPSGWSVNTPFQGIISPSGWSGTVVGQEESTNLYIEWKVTTPSPTAPDTSKFIQPGQTLTGFDVVLDTPDATYSTSSFELIRIGSTPASAPLQEVAAVDIPPPALSLQLNPSKLWPPNSKMIEIGVTVSATSSSGQPPVIKLLSITCDDSCDHSKDISGAVFGTDDRLFSLRAMRKGESQSGRTYTITYSATDSLNQSTQRSATVVVPHDQSK